MVSDYATVSVNSLTVLLALLQAVEKTTQTMHTGRNCVLPRSRPGIRPRYIQVPEKYKKKFQLAKRSVDLDSSSLYEAPLPASKHFQRKNFDTSDTKSFPKAKEFLTEILSFFSCRACPSYPSRYRYGVSEMLSRSDK